MSSTTADARYDEHADTWRKWQLGNATNSRRSAIHARIVFAVILTGAAVWLSIQFYSSPAWS